MRYYEIERRDRNGIKTHPYWRSGIHHVAHIDDSDHEDDVQREFEVRIPRQYLGSRAYTYISKCAFLKRLLLRHYHYVIIITSLLLRHFITSLLLRH